MPKILGGASGMPVVRADCRSLYDMKAIILVVNAQKKERFMIFKTYQDTLITIHVQQAESVKQCEPPAERRRCQLPLVHPDRGADRPRRRPGERNCGRNRPVHQE